MTVETRRVILGVSAGIAAYKAAELARALKKGGVDVRVVMTANATRFVAPLTFQALSGHPVGVDLWDDSEWGMGHIDRAREADLFLVAPATANVLARLAGGFADDLLTTAALATEAPLWVAPSMNPNMLAHPATQSNLRTLRERGVRVLEPGVGEVACGDVGPGRLPEPEEIAREVFAFFDRRDGRIDDAAGDRTGVTAGDRTGVTAGDRTGVTAGDRTDVTAGDMAGVTILVTAGPTREHLDPVRFVSNPSTGRMGYALAEAAAARGARVVLVSGPTDLTTPPGTERIDVRSAGDLAAACLDRFADVDIAIAAAAVSDYAPVEYLPRKMKKGDDEIVVRFRRTPDVLAEMGARKRPGQVLVGFAAETDDVESNARDKIRRKNLDLIVVNDVTEPGAGFAVETNRVVLLDREGNREAPSLMSKRALADLILDRALARRSGVAGP